MEIKERLEELKKLSNRQREELQMTQQRVSVLTQTILQTQGGIIELEKLNQPKEEKK